MKSIGELISRAKKKQFNQGSIPTNYYYLKYYPDYFNLDFRDKYVSDTVNQYDDKEKEDLNYNDYPIQTHSLLIHGLNKIDEDLRDVFDFRNRKVSSFSFTYKFKVGFEYISFLNSIQNESNSKYITRRNNVITITDSKYLNLDKYNSVDFNFGYLDENILEVTFNIKIIDVEFLSELYKDNVDLEEWERRLFKKNDVVKEKKENNKQYLTFEDISNSSFPDLLLRYNMSYLNNFLFKDTFNFVTTELDIKDLLTYKGLLEKNILEEIKVALESSLKAKEIQKVTYDSKMKLLEEIEINLECLGDYRIGSNDVVTSICSGMYHYNEGYKSYLVYESTSSNLDVLLCKKRC